jgi:hypothetical protein
VCVQPNADDGVTGRTVGHPLGQAGESGGCLELLEATDWTRSRTGWTRCRPRAELLWTFVDQTAACVTDGLQVRRYDERPSTQVINQVSDARSLRREPNTRTARCTARLDDRRPVAHISVGHGLKSEVAVRQAEASCTALDDRALFGRPTPDAGVFHEQNPSPAPTHKQSTSDRRPLHPPAVRSALPESPPAVQPRVASGALAHDPSSDRQRRTAGRPLALGGSAGRDAQRVL